MLVKEGLVYRFSHRSFQEYFAAWYTCKLTDDIQAKLLSNWIKESDSIFSDSYFQMLFDLQSEKVNKIVLCPILSEVKKLYLEKGFSLELLNELFEGLQVGKRTVNNSVSYNVSLTISNQYLCYGLMLNNRLNEYPYEKSTQEKEKEIYEKIERYMIEKEGEKVRKLRRFSMSFEDVLKIVSEQELLECLKWFEKQILYAMHILEECEDGNISRKKKVSSILEEL